MGAIVITDEMMMIILKMWQVAYTDSWLIVIFHIVEMSHYILLKGSGGKLGI